MVDKALQLEEPSTLDLFDRWGSRIPTLQYGDWYLYSFSSMVIRTNSPVWRLFFYLRAQWQLRAGQVIMTCIFMLLRDFHILNCLLCLLLFMLMPVVGLIFNSGSEPVHFGYIDIIWSFVSMDAETTVGIGEMWLCGFCLIWVLRLHFLFGSSVPGEGQVWLQLGYGFHVWSYDGSDSLWSMKWWSRSLYLFLILQLIMRFSLRLQLPSGILEKSPLHELEPGLVLVVCLLDDMQRVLRWHNPYFLEDLDI